MLLKFLGSLTSFDLLFSFRTFWIWKLHQDDTLSIFLTMFILTQPNYLGIRVQIVAVLLNECVCVIPNSLKVSHWLRKYTSQMVIALLDLLRNLETKGGNKNPSFKTPKQKKIHIIKQVLEHLVVPTLYSMYSWKMRLGQNHPILRRPSLQNKETLQNNSLGNDPGWTPTQNKSYSY